MKKTVFMLVTLLLVSLTSVSWAAKNERSPSPPSSESNVASETKSGYQTQATTENAVVPQDSPTVRKTTQETATSIEPKSERPQTAPAEASDGAAFEIPWQSVNGGGGPMASANYRVNSSAGQSSIGYSSSASYQAGIGYWYGVSATTGCSCPYQCDYDEDNFLTALDLGGLIDVLFAGAPEVTDPDCPTSRGDFDCDGFPTALDLGGLIDHLFAGGAAPCDPCSP